MTERRRLSTGSVFERRFGFSRAVDDGDYVFVSGCTGFDYQTGTIAPGVAEQTRQTVHNIESVLARAGCKLSDVVQKRVYVTSSEALKEAEPVIGEAFAKVKPANTTLICQLVDPRMKIEIEVTARKPRRR